MQKNNRMLLQAGWNLHVEPARRACDSELIPPQTARVANSLAYWYFLGILEDKRIITRKC